MPATETVTAAQVASTAVATEPVIAESEAPAAPVIETVREPELAPKPEQPETAHDISAAPPPGRGTGGRGDRAGTGDDARDDAGTAATADASRKETGQHGSARADHRRSCACPDARRRHRQLGRHCGSGYRQRRPIGRRRAGRRSAGLSGVARRLVGAAQGVSSARRGRAAKRAPCCCGSRSTGAAGC